MKQMKCMLPIVLVLIAVYLLPLAAAANDFPEDPDGPTVPVDGGLSLLLAAGAGYVVKKGADKRRKRK